MSATNKPLVFDPATAHESNVPRILGLGISFHVVALVAFALRIYTRTVIVKSFGKDDLMLCLCMVGLTGGGMVTIAVATAHGLGRHAFTLSEEDVIIYGITVFIQALFTTITSLCLLKLSVAFSLLRLAGPMNKWWTRVIWGLMIFICLYMVESWISILAFCDPIAAHWDKKVLRTAKCWDPAVFRIFPLFNTGCNMFTDVCFATLPIPIIWRLQMKRRTRIYLIGVFSLGYVAVFIGVAKVVSQVRFRGDPDAVFHNWTQTLGFLQQNVGVVAACAPALRPLVGQWLKLSDSTKEYGGSYGSHSKRCRGGTKADGGEAGFEMESSSNRTPRFGTAIGSKYNATVKGGTSPSSSEERIIGSGWKAEDINGRVMKTTEIYVK
ncbi:hypothetical protein QBC34DRAFT_97790 [Podospora aff. communis PSN243]|uniref:Rhodopsin domain-containing protein n=1 Tax=Podospora aff. communis PSN243 TaxID=3040156 RepID=A0AAV9GKJ8_9PEZI|nr:hypothetical protein QBC34DRAFT_97790 [Podospora aff. communis PSN243]